MSGSSIARPAQPGPRPPRPHATRVEVDAYLDALAVSHGYDPSHPEATAALANDYSHAVLEDQTLDHLHRQGANFSGASFAGSTLDHCSLRGANCDGAVFSHAYARFTNFGHAVMSGAMLDGMVMEGGSLKGVDLTSLAGSVALPAAIRGVICSGVRLAGLDLSGVEFAPYVLDDADLRGARISHMVLGLDAVCAGLDCSDATLDGCVMRGARLSGASFAGATISGCDFSDALAPNVDFSRARLTDCLLCRAILSRAVFDGAVLRAVDSKGAVVSPVHAARAAEGGDGLGLSLADARWGSLERSAAALRQDLDAGLASLQPADDADGISAGL